VKECHTYTPNKQFHSSFRVITSDWLSKFCFQTREETTLIVELNSIQVIEMEMMDGCTKQEI